MQPELELVGTEGHTDGHLYRRLFELQQVYSVGHDLTERKRRDEIELEESKLDPRVSLAQKPCAPAALIAAVTKLLTSSGGVTDKALSH